MLPLRPPPAHLHDLLSNHTQVRKCRRPPKFPMINGVSSEDCLVILGRGLEGRCLQSTCCTHPAGSCLYSLTMNILQRDDKIFLLRLAFKGLDDEELAEVAADRIPHLPGELRAVRGGRV